MSQWNSCRNMGKFWVSIAWFPRVSKLDLMVRCDRTRSFCRVGWALWLWITHTNVSWALSCGDGCFVDDLRGDLCVARSIKLLVDRFLFVFMIWAGSEILWITVIWLISSYMDARKLWDHENKILFGTQLGSHFSLLASVLIGVGPSAVLMHTQTALPTVPKAVHGWFQKTSHSIIPRWEGTREDWGDGGRGLNLNRGSDGRG